MARNDLQPYPLNTTINMIQEDIDFGIAQDSYSCAFAHAIMRTNPNAIRVRVNRNKVAWTDAAQDIRIVYPTPEVLDKEVIEPFDKHLPVKPRRITLRGGEFRGCRHDENRRRLQRDHMREVKAQTVLETGAPPPGPRSFVQATGDRTFERYVETAGDL